jgi:Na+-translocating ferredoxin:NAD+ oxidoreductase RnfG subunit
VEILALLAILAILAILIPSPIKEVVIGKMKKKEQEKEQEMIALMLPEERQKYLAAKAEKEARLESYKAEKEARLERQQARERNPQYGGINTAMVCPHCQSIGKIRTKEVKQKKGVSGGKATAAVLTGGLSLLAVGLSRKEGATQAHCDNCHNTWFF